MTVNNLFGSRLFKTMLGSGNRYLQNKQVIGGSLTLPEDGPQLHFIDGGLASRTITLPALKKGLYQRIFNIGTTNAVVIQSAAAVAVVTLAFGDSAQLFCDGTTWYVARSGGAISGVAGGYKIARGQQSTVAASDTIITGLATVVAAVATIETDVDATTLAMATCQIGDQAGAPAAGSIILKTWKATSASVTTLIAATSFSKKVNWVAIGT